MATLDPQDPPDHWEQLALLARMVRLDQQDQLVRMAVEDPKALSAQPDPLARLDQRVPME